MNSLCGCPLCPALSSITVLTRAILFFYDMIYKAIWNGMCKPWSGLRLARPAPRGHNLSISSLTPVKFRCMPLFLRVRVWLAISQGWGLLWKARLDGSIVLIAELQLSRSEVWVIKHIWSTHTEDLDLISTAVLEMASCASLITKH